ncbi:hypothetical protein B0H13DRAFT_2650538 [Mycena leptocephala]|nr:hypothetical protein B0H13DRAFT_2650538 [Mycena leptocephala]
MPVRMTRRMLWVRARGAGSFLRTSAQCIGCTVCEHVCLDWAWMCKDEDILDDEPHGELAPVEGLKAPAVCYVQREVSACCVRNFYLLSTGGGRARRTGTEASRDVFVEFAMVTWAPSTLVHAGAIDRRCTVCDEGRDSACLLVLLPAYSPAQFYPRQRFSEDVADSTYLSSPSSHAPPRFPPPFRCAPPPSLRPCGPPFSRSRPPVRLSSPFTPPLPSVHFISSALPPQSHPHSPFFSPPSLVFPSALLLELPSAQRYTHPPAPSYPYRPSQTPSPPHPSPCPERDAS